MAHIVTITNPVTGQPAQVDQLDHTAQQIDDAVEAARWSHRNLLDNAYWSNPDAIIDQRGGYVVPPGASCWQAGDVYVTTDKYYKVEEITADNTAKITINGVTSYAHVGAHVRGYTGAGYGIDRWDLFGGTNPTMLIENGHIRLTGSGYFRQIIPVSQIPRGTLVTFSILMASGELYSLTTTVPDNQVDSPQVFFPGGFLRIFGWNADTDAYFIWFDGEVSPVAMKLELGDTQTLAHQDENGNWQLNELLNYADTLARCQRYQFEFFDRTVTGQGYLVHVKAISSTHALGVLPTPVTMREGCIPSVLTDCSVDNPYNAFGTYSTGYSDGIKVITLIEVYSKMQNGVILRATGSNFVAGNDYTIWVSNQKTNQFLLDLNL